jgi:hypothetical protein
MKSAILENILSVFSCSLSSLKDYTIANPISLYPSPEKVCVKKYSLFPF